MSQRLTHGEPTQIVPTLLLTGRWLFCWEPKCVRKIPTTLRIDLEDFQADSFTLATLTFDTLAFGTSPLEITGSVLGDAWGDSLIADLESSSISPVPEPATLLLLASGLAGWGILGGRGY